MPKLTQGSLLHELALAEDADPITQRLDLAEDVRREKHGTSVRTGLGDRVAERGLHQRVQSARRFVEDQKLRAGREGGDQLDLLPVALGVVTNPLVRLEVEPFDQRLTVAIVDRAVQPAEELETLPTGERGP